MPRYVIFWGHGSWSDKESPAKVAVPTGCRLLLFARHKEEISTNRMHAIVDWLCRRQDETDFVALMKDFSSLRRIKRAGETVHNYRLYPQDMGLPVTDDEVPDLYTLVTTDRDDGVTLASLMAEHGAPGTTLMWLPCRALKGEMRLVDGYDAPSLAEFNVLDEAGKVTGQHPFYHRPEKGYFKATSKKG